MTIQAKQSIKSRFIQYVLPSVAAMWVYTIYTMADGIFVARGVGEQALAAVNLCMPMINGAFSMGILFAVGASTKASIHKGRGDTQESNRVFTLGAMTVASIGLLATLFVLLLLPQLARLLGADAHTLPYVKGYLGIIGLFLPFYMTSYYLEVLVKADGFPKLAIKTSIAGAMTNIVLDAIFVLVFHWGIEGAAVATGLSQAMTFSIYLRHFLARRPSRKAAASAAKSSGEADGNAAVPAAVNTGFTFVHVRWQPQAVFRFAKLGLADCVTELSIGLCIFVFNRTLLAVSGSDGVVIYTVISYFAQLVLMTMMGINQGSQPLISYYYGRGKSDFCSYIFRLALCCAGVCAIVAFVIGFLCPAPIVNIYIDHETSPDLFARGIRAFRLYAPAFLPLGIVIPMMGYFTSLELPKQAMSISLGRGMLFAICALLLLAFLFGESGIWVSAVVSETCTLTLALLLYRRSIQNICGNARS